MKQNRFKTPFFRLCAFILALTCTVSTYTLYIDKQEKDNSIMALSKIGSRGEEVRRIQNKLKQLGFYNGSVDGIYGAATQRAVAGYKNPQEQPTQEEPTSQQGLEPEIGPEYVPQNTEESELTIRCPYCNTSNDFSSSKCKNCDAPLR